MKHTLKITIIIIAMFLTAQFIGLAVINSYNQNFSKTALQTREEAIAEGQPVPPEPDVSVIKETIPPEVKLKKTVDAFRIVFSLVVAILIATALFFLLSRVKVTILLKLWFSFVVFICLTIALTLFLHPLFSKALLNISGKQFILAELIALPLALCLTFFKIVKRNFFIHNLTELFIYPGLVVILLPLFAYSVKYRILVVSLILIAISIYDMIAVWKTKYMVKLAKFQMNQMKVFAGFFIPYIKPKDRIKIQKMKVMARRKEKERKTKKGKGKGKTGKKQKGKGLKIKVEIGALGGGDVAFSLLFAGTIFLAYGLLASIITILCTTLALALLLAYSKKGRFYPAMPFISAGCFLGLLLVKLLL